MLKQCWANYQNIYSIICNEYSNLYCQSQGGHVHRAENQSPEDQTMAIICPTALPANFEQRPSERGCRTQWEKGNLEGGGIFLQVEAGGQKVFNCYCIRNFLCRRSKNKTVVVAPLNREKNIDGKFRLQIDSRRTLARGRKPTGACPSK